MPRLGRDIRAFEDFTGERPRTVTRTSLPDRDLTGWRVGKAVGVAYEARRDGVTDRYFHEFKPASRPDLVAADDGRKLYFAGGSYKVTDRGIEDMPHLFVVNPHKRGTAKRKKPAMAARRRRRASGRRRTRRTQIAMFANPIRRRRRRRSHARGRRRSYAMNPIRRFHRRRRTHVRRYRRNPSARGVAVSVQKLFLPAMGIGAGAVGSEILMGYLPIPAQFKTGVWRHVTKGAVGVAAGLVLGKVLKQRRLGNYFALGAIAIATHDALKEFISARMSGVQMGYMPRVRGSLGYVNPAATARLGYMPTVHGSLGGHHNARAVGGETGVLV